MPTRTESSLWADLGALVKLARGWGPTPGRLLNNLICARRLARFRRVLQPGQGRDDGEAAVQQDNLTCEEPRAVRDHPGDTVGDIFDGGTGVNQLFADWPSVISIAS